MDDLLIVITNYGHTDFDTKADLNADGVVNLYDLILVARALGQSA